MEFSPTISKMASFSSPALSSTGPVQQRSIKILVRDNLSFHESCSSYAPPPKKNGVLKKEEGVRSKEVRFNSVSIKHDEDPLVFVLSELFKVPLTNDWNLLSWGQDTTERFFFSARCGYLTRRAVLFDWCQRQSYTAFNESPP